MKIGSSISLLMVILIAFGYLISDDIQTHGKLNEVAGKINGLTSQLTQSESNLKLCTDQVTKDQQALEQRDQKISELNATVNSLEVQIGQLSIENSVDQAKQAVSELLGSNPIVVVSLLILQVLSLAIGKGRIAGMGFPFSRQSTKNSYVRLTEAEHKLIVQRRRDSR